MPGELQQVKVAILVARGFELVELTQPREALEQAGAETFIISNEKESVRSWDFTDWGQEFPVDVPLEDAVPSGYHALLLPGGVMNPDKLRILPKAQEFVRHFFEKDKPVAVICHGPWTLIDAGVVRGRRITSWPSLQTDLRNAGAQWIDEEAVTDGNLVSSRKPDDIPAFNRAMIAEIVDYLQHRLPAESEAEEAEARIG